ncbi:hypothetical protein Tco_0025763 [Tanacetum coccineum]
MQTTFCSEICVLIAHKLAKSYYLRQPSFGLNLLQCNHDRLSTINIMQLNLLLVLIAAAKTPFRVRAKEDMELGKVSDDLDRGPSGKVVSGIHVRLLLIRGLLAVDSTFSISPGTGYCISFSNRKWEVGRQHMSSVCLWTASSLDFRTADVSSRESKALLGQVSDDLVIRTINEALEKLSCEQLVHSEWILTTKDRGPSGKVVSGIHYCVETKSNSAVSVLVIENGKWEGITRVQFVCGLLPALISEQLKCHHVNPRLSWYLQNV